MRLTLILFPLWLLALVVQSPPLPGMGGPDVGAAPIVRGLSIYGMDNEQNFPVIVRDSVDSEGKPVRSRQYVTVQFDVLASDPPDLKIRFYHCTRDWNPDVNLFVQDEVHNTSFVLDFRTAPNGVTNYRYRYINRFPDTQDIVRFDYSGKWMFRLMDKSESTVFGEGRFIVADGITPTRMSVVNDYLTENPSPLNQIHKVIVNVRLPSEVAASYFTTVDVLQNRRLGHSFRIDVNDRDSYTFVDGYGTGTRTFSVSNIFPGNEYRTLDISNSTRYPNKSIVRSFEGADQMRAFWRTGPDRNGTALLNRFAGINSEYLEVLFRLDLTGSDLRSVTADGRDIYLVGPFNQWEPTPEYRLVYDETEHSLVTMQLLRRGVYDYQYVTGIWDESTHLVAQQDWLVLEGNDWRTSDVYSALVYYNDPRFGGFDRIVGFAQTRSIQALPGSQ